MLFGPFLIFKIIEINRIDLVNIEFQGIFFLHSGLVSI
jgi:hypothetical protein